VKPVGHEFEDFAVESNHAKHRDKKVRGPKVVMDNPGLRTVTTQLANQLRSRVRTHQLGEK
jgi:hypothetical protein